MKTNIFTSVNKKGFGHTVLGVFLMLSLVLQNAAYVQYAFANTTEESSSTADTTVVVASSDVSSEEHESLQTEETHDSVQGSNEEEREEMETARHGDVDSEKHEEEHASVEGQHHDGDENKNEDEHDHHVGTIKDILHDMNGAKPAVTIVAHKVVCSDESKLPNWGLGGADITAHTAADYVASHPGCVLTPDWKFQWGFSGVKDLGGNFLGEADGSKGIGSNTGSGLSDWKTFGPSDASGVATVKVYDLQGSPKIWVREVMKDGYVPFSYDPAHPVNDNPVSAEMYCNSDVLNYDNYDFIANPSLGATYNCVAFNALKSVVPPVVVSASCPFTAATGTYVVNYGTARSIISSGSHADANVTKDINIPVGTYEVSLFSYDTSATRSTESQPNEKWYLRIHNGTTLIATSSAIADLADNVTEASRTQYVGDVVLATPATMVMAKHAAWPDTTSTNALYPVCAQLKLKSAPVNQAPVITVIGENPLTIVQNTVFADPGATAFDLEDGTITPVATGTVNSAVIGSYVITYTATDSKGATATPKTRTVNVVPQGGGCTTNCTATNTAPVITVVGLNPLTIVQNTVFTDPGATAFDLEDGTITPVATGTVNTAATGTYLITYTATDSKGATATPKTRTVVVVPVGTTINQKPEITLLGNIVMELVVGTTFTDPSATVADAEDGNITNKLVATGTVDVNTIGSYTITYNATDSQNLAADTKTRIVNVVAAPVTPPGCTANCGGGSTTFTYPGCIDPNASNYNRLANKDDGSCSYPGGGGGGGSVPLAISNEKLEVTGTTSVTVTWNTNLPSDSRVVYGLASVPTIGVKPSYGYPLTTATDTTNVYNHSVVIVGVPSAIATYYRPVSATASETATGIELNRTPATGGTGSTGGSCEYLKEYLRIGVNNNPSEVTKLQLFLKNYDNATNLEVTGFFDVTTDAAVRAFQDRYKTDVLDAWNLPSNTGYVYYTTKKKINEIYCQREFPLTDDQKAEIVAFRALIERANTLGTTVGSEFLPIVGSNTTRGGSSAGSVAGAATEKPTPVTVSVTPSNYAALDAEAGKTTTGADKPENRGRIAIADLLATAPSIAEDVMGDTETDGDEISETGTGTVSGVVAGTSTTKSMLASVVNSLTTRFNQCSPATIYFTLIFLILALIFATLYFRKEKAEVPIEAEVVTKE